MSMFERMPWDELRDGHDEPFEPEICPFCEHEPCACEPIPGFDDLDDDLRYEDGTVYYGELP